CAITVASPTCLQQNCRAPRALHSFPTRRSSDLSPPPPVRGDNDYDPNEPVITANELNTRNAALSSARTVIKFLGTLSRSSSKKRSEEHTSELQSRENLVCRLLLEKKNQHQPADR